VNIWGKPAENFAMLANRGQPIALDLETYGTSEDKKIRKGETLDPWRGEIRLLSLQLPDHNLQVGSVLPATIRAPAEVMRSNAAPLSERVAKVFGGFGPFFLKKTTQLKPPNSRRRLTENGLPSIDLESRFYAVLSKAAQVA
jgi:hypothetical protein